MEGEIKIRLCAFPFQAFAHQTAEGVEPLVSHVVERV